MTFEEKIKSVCENTAFGEPMAGHTTFRIGGKARAFADVSTAEEIAALTKICRESGERFIVIGRGSNVLFSDKGFDGLVISVGKKMAGVTMDNGVIRAGAGLPLACLASFAMENGIGGFETLSGIPGFVGGAVRMNAGAYGGEIKDVLLAVTYIEDGSVRRISAGEAGLSYRHSIFTENPERIILEAEFSADTKKDKAEILAYMSELSAKRREKQPLEYPSAGSTFKRPEGYFAAKLIDDAGLRGYRVGGAMVSEKHAGFVINAGSASFDDVMEVVRHVRETVLEKSGVSLETEIEIIE